MTTYLDIEGFAKRGVQRLHDQDRALYDLLQREYERQNNVLSMVASCSVADPSVVVCEGTTLANVTTEGYPGARYHAGCAVVDDIERLAVERAKSAFRAQYANVQPHSGSSANEVVLFSLLSPGDTILGMELNAGGHLTHGAKASISGLYFESVGYGLGADNLLDYDLIRSLAVKHKPKLIIAGASAYPRTIEFARFREIADEVGAYLLADISHISGLVAAGEHPSPIDHAHFTTTSTYKQLFGPRGGLILMGRDHDGPAPSGKGTLSAMIQRAVFPRFQGTPNLGAIAAKARALDMVQQPEFAELAKRIIANARCLAAGMHERGYEIVAGGTDNHMVLVDLTGHAAATGVIAERALEQCGIIVNRNRIPNDTKPALVTSGLRIGTNSVAARGMGDGEIRECVSLIDYVVSSVKPTGDSTYELAAQIPREVESAVRDLCRRFPLPHYTLEAAGGPV